MKSPEEILEARRVALTRRPLVAWLDPATRVVHLQRHGAFPLPGTVRIGEYVCPSCAAREDAQPCDRGTPTPDVPGGTSP